jgi:hypothetical protein
MFFGSWMHGVFVVLPKGTHSSPWQPPRMHLFSGVKHAVRSVLQSVNWQRFAGSRPFVTIRPFSQHDRTSVGQLRGIMPPSSRGSTICALNGSDTMSRRRAITGCPPPASSMHRSRSAVISHEHCPPALLQWAEA